MKNTLCPQCGAPHPANATTCVPCGAALPASNTAGGDNADPAPPLSTQDNTDTSASEASTLVWQVEAKLLNNRFFLGDMIKTTTITMAVCAAIFIPLFGISGGLKGVEAALIFLCIPLVLILLGTLIFVLIMGNRLPMEFTIDRDGINMKSISRRVTNINRTAMILGALSGKPGAVGAGALGASQENTTILWPDLSKVRFYQKDNVIFLKGGILSRIRLYCLPQNYAQVSQMIRCRLPDKAIVETP